MMQKYHISKAVLEQGQKSADRHTDEESEHGSNPEDVEAENSDTSYRPSLGNSEEASQVSEYHQPLQVRRQDAAPKRQHTITPIEGDEICAYMRSKKSTRRSRKWGTQCTMIGKRTPRKSGRHPESSDHSYGINNAVCGRRQQRSRSRCMPAVWTWIATAKMEPTTKYQTLRQRFPIYTNMGVSRVVRTAVREEPASPTQGVELQIAPAPLIILDWDDTILPNTHLAKLGFSSEDETFEVPEECVPTLEELAKEAENFLNACLKTGPCCIVTNGLTGWVERSCQRFLPNAVPLLAHMTIVSARSNFESVYPDRPIEWKIAAYRDLLAKRGFMQEPPAEEPRGVYVQREPQQVIALGDSQVDRCAIQYVARRTPNTQLKSIKLLDNPSMTQLQKQLNLLGVFLVQLSGHDEALDLELSNEMLQ
ncbi:hypothetical protein PHYPSEUDO_002634 [Phytophthora pseudosyringae]|uniref:Uncharacterized protein n=1 Tax=Phytophthora pseudosyringae TaxID=221518 RepID=A0A8T1VWN9_9STRA|nr:hypothetical protein PHYPSEUDO_002634 [Phytophthora pseudosyringae]